MDQLAQKLKDGRMEVLEVPTPALAPGNVLVRNLYSLVSAGTEGSTVKGGWRDGPEIMKLDLPQTHTDGHRRVRGSLIDWIGSIGSIR